MLCYPPHLNIFFYFSVFIVFIFLYDMKGLMNASIEICLLLHLAFFQVFLLLRGTLEPIPVQ